MMELGAKIKQLRNKSGLTQEQLAKQLGISPQSVSKWENAIAMPDITLLPVLSGELGVSIDELFDLTTEQKFHRIEKRMESEEELSPENFKEYEEFLQAAQSDQTDSARAISLLAHLYHHRMESDARRVRKYAREAILRHPERKDCQWLLTMAEGQVCWDWNCSNHASIISFYKEVIEKDTVIPKTPLPYYYLIDNLIADHRTEEAKQYLQLCRAIPAHKPFLLTVYEAYIALAEYDAKKADRMIEVGLKTYADNGGFLFEAAQYYARKCEYEKAIACYEESWKLEECQKPRYTDALQGIAVIHEITGNLEKAVETFNRMLSCLTDEWGYSEDDIAVLEILREKNRLLR